MLLFNWIFLPKYIKNKAVLFGTTQNYELKNLSNSSEGETNNEFLKNIAKTIYLLVNKN